jgi:hypothetical protein
MTLGLVCLTALAAGMQLEVIPLKHRTVNDVIPVLRPLVTPGGALTGTANQLIIKSTPANIAEIKRVLAGIDRAQRRLLITVRQDSAGGVSRDQRSLSGTWSSGDVTVSGGDSGGSMRIGSRDANGNHVEYRSRSRRSDSENRNTYTVQALEGSPAFIRAGSLVPVPARTVTVAPGAAVQRDTVEYHDATSGFYVLPRLNGDTVTLLVAPRLSGGGPGGFDVQDVETTVSGRLGQWLRIGGINESSRRRSGGSFSDAQRQSQMTRSILLKVEELGGGD